MSREHLGLFDTPANSQQVRSAATIVGLALGGVLLVLPVANRQWGEVPAFVPIVDTVMLVCDLIIATLLYAQGAVFRSRALLILASGYLIAALMLVPHALSFPGAFAPTGLFGAGTSTTGWIAFFWRHELPIAVILYALMKRDEAAKAMEPGRRYQGVIGWIAGSILLAAVATVIAFRSDSLLPSIFADRANAVFAHLLLANLSMIVVTLVAIAVLMRQRQAVLDLWLLAVMATLLIQTILNLAIDARFTIGFYCLFLIMMVSQMILLLVLIAESNRLHARLALANAARMRESEARLMTMDAVAAAFAHEVGQPLTAIKLNTSVALTLLTATRPNLAKAVESLRVVQASGERSFDIVRSIRAMVAKGPDGAMEFSLNDLVRETVTLLERELAGGRVTLELLLEEALPRILATRIQIQQVLVNLITNAIESLAESSGRRRRITIRTATVDEETVSFHVSDSGKGIAPGEEWRIFETFHTTKPAGVGIGLSLCRTTIEEHGGRIWAAPGETEGVTFHVELPLTRFRQIAASQ